MSGNDKDTANKEEELREEVEEDEPVHAKPMSKAKRRMEQINKSKRKQSSASPDNSNKGETAGSPTDASPSTEEGQGGSAADEEGSIDLSDCWGHDSYPPIRAPQKIEYCPNCGLPPDFCEYSDSWESKCKAWVMKYYLHYYPHLAPLKAPDMSPVPSSSTNAAASNNSKGKGSLTSSTPGNLDDKLSNLSISNNGLQSGESATAEEPPLKKKGGGGKKTAAKKEGVTVQKVSRAKNKTVTVVIGLETLGVKLDKASKLFSKRFSCGASVVKGGSGLPDQIDIQGDVGDMLGEVLSLNFPEVTSEKITYLKSK